ncbi:MAG: glyceraldehyde-3-phosphate dehydrogenase [Candidatus Dadabacteria bacterium]|nr:MAG: glyceraldehyde-3-phosphate dehydrogenase [Candidatus Dadabacteria bacterium]
MSANKGEQYFQLWNESEALATKMMPILSDLRVERGVLVHVFGRSIAKVSSVEILKVHRHARLILGRELTVQDTFPVLQAVAKLDLGPCRIDLGKLTVRYQKEGGDLDAFVARELASVTTGPRPVLEPPQDVVLYGFGRIGRLLARILVDKTGKGDKLRVRAAVVRKPKEPDLHKRASLFRLDSVHGPFQGTTMVDEAENAIVANGNLIRILYADDPSSIDYTQYGIQNAIVVDNTGKWRDRKGLGQHLEAKGVKSVLLTAPGKGDIPNIVYGVNHHTLDPNERIVSAASCTTNAIVPVLKVIQDRYGIECGHVETCHAYTNDQNLIDNFHKKPRRGRAAALNMVITSTGAAEAAAKALPELKGKLTGNAVRVPTPDVSLAIMNLRLEKPTTREELNDYLRRIALDSPLQNQIDFTTSPDIVSSDLIGSRHAGVVDGEATIVNGADGRNVVLYVWYDNEFGYACQVMRLLQQMAGLDLPELPKSV